MTRNIFVIFELVVLILRENRELSFKMVIASEEKFKNPERVLEEELLQT